MAQTKVWFLTIIWEVDYNPLIYPRFQFFFVCVLQYYCLCLVFTFSQSSDDEDVSMHEEDQAANGDKTLSPTPECKNDSEDLPISRM